MRFHFDLQFRGGPLQKLQSVKLALLCFLFTACHVATLSASELKIDVSVIIDKLPVDREQKMKDFHDVVKKYLDEVDWLEDDDEVPMDISLQLFLNTAPSNVEDRYQCEFLISSSDVQYFDRRVRFPYQPGDILQYDEAQVGPLTGVLNFYMNMVLGSELDKYRELGGEVYYKRAQNFAALGKFVRTEFVRGWTERDELSKRVVDQAFTKFRKMKDYYFYGLYLIQEEDNLKQGLASVAYALQLLEEVKQKALPEMEEHNQFINAHYNEIVDLFKAQKDRDEIFRRMIRIDPDHEDIYKEHLSEL